MMTAILLFCGISVLTSCSKDDDNTAPQLSDIWDAETGTLIVNSNPRKDAYRGRTDIKKLIGFDEDYKHKILKICMETTSRPSME